MRATFVVTSSGPGIAPFLALIAADLSTDLPAIAHLFSVQALVWGRRRWSPECIPTVMADAGS